MNKEIIKFRIPVGGKGQIDIEARRGYLIHLEVGDQTVKFVLQLNARGDIEALVHFATGRILEWAWERCPIEDAEEFAQDMMRSVLKRKTPRQIFEAIARCDVLNPEATP